MDNVLIAIDSCDSSFWLAFHAMSLARRVKAKVSILMVIDEELARKDDSDEWIGLPEKRLESLVAEQNSELAHVDYYVARGSFKDEVVRFINESGTTSLVVGRPDTKDSRIIKRFMTMLGQISRKTNCYIDVVQSSMNIGRET